MLFFVLTAIGLSIRGSSNGRTFGSEPKNCWVRILIPEPFAASGPQLIGCVELTPVIQ